METEHDSRDISCGDPACQLCPQRALIERYATRCFVIDCPDCGLRNYWQEDEPTPVSCEACSGDLSKGLEG